MAAQFPSGIKVFVDDVDITYWIFGSDTLTIDDSNSRFTGIDLTPYCSGAGEHRIEVTCDTGVGRVEARIQLD